MLKKIMALVLSMVMLFTMVGTINVSAAADERLTQTLDFDTAYEIMVNMVGHLYTLGPKDRDDLYNWVHIYMSTDEGVDTLITLVDDQSLVGSNQLILDYIASFGDTAEKKSELKTALTLLKTVPIEARKKAFDDMKARVNFSLPVTDPEQAAIDRTYEGFLLEPMAVKLGKTEDEIIEMFEHEEHMIEKPVMMQFLSDFNQTFVITDGLYNCDDFALYGLNEEFKGKLKKEFSVEPEKLIEDIIESANGSGKFDVETKKDFKTVLGIPGIDMYIPRVLGMTIAGHKTQIEGEITPVTFTATSNVKSDEDDLKDVVWYVNEEYKGEGETFTYTPDGVGEYKIKATLGDGWESEEVITVNATAPAEVLNISSEGKLEQIECSEELVKFTATTTPERADLTDVEWYVNGEYKGEGETFEFTPEGPGAYEVYALLEGKPSEETITVNVKCSPISIEAEGELNQESDDRTPVTFTAVPEIDGADLTGVEWYVGDEKQSTTGATFTFTPDAAGEYVVKAVMPDGTESTNTITVKVKLSYTLNISASGSLEQYKGAETDVTFTATSTYVGEGVDLTETKWFVNGIEQSETGATFEFTPDGIGDYAVHAVLGEEQSEETITVKVKSAPISIEAEGSLNQTTENMTSVTFTAVTDVVGADLTGAKWYVNGEYKGEGATFTFAPSKEGTYVVKAIMPDGTESRNIITVNVKHSYTLHISTSDSIEQFDGAETPVTFTATSTYVGEGVDLAETKWFVNGIDTNETGATFTYTPDGIGTYAVHAVLGGVQSVETIKVKVESAPISIEAEGVLNQTTENMTAVTFTAVTDVVGADLTGAKWYVNGEYKGEGATFTFTPSEKGTYVVKAKMPDETESTNTITVSVTTVPATHGLHISSVGSLEQFDGAEELVTFTATSTPAGVDLTSVKWFVNGTDTNETGATFTYTPDGAGNYVVHAVLGEVKSAETITVKVKSVPISITSTGSLSQTTENMTAVTFTAVTDVVGADLTGVEWYVGDDKQSTTGETFTFTPSEKGTYVVKAKMPDGTESTNTITVKVDLLYTLNISSVGSLEQLAGEEDAVTFTAVPTYAGVDLAETKWFVNGIEKGTGATFTYTPDGAGNYVVHAVLGEVQSAETITVKVKSLPFSIEAEGSLNQKRGSTTPVTFTAISDPAGADLTALKWYVNGDYKGEGATFTYTPSTVGSYVVKAKMPDGTESTNTITVSVTSSVGGGGSYIPPKDKEPDYGDISKPIIAPTETDKITQFEDVEGHWAEPYMESLYELGIVKGTSETTMDPDWGITRQEVAVLLVRMLGLENEVPQNETYYTDWEDVASWAKTSVGVLSARGIYVGYGDGSFQPERIISRQELVSVIGRQLSGEYEIDLHYEDTHEIYYWAVEHVEELTAFGIIQGYPDDTFRPVVDITRAQAAVIFYNTMYRLGMLKIKL